MSGDNENDDRKFKVGYGKPPVHTRFKPGRSGNPKGRPKGQRNLGSEVSRALIMPVPVTFNGRHKNVSTMTALVWRLREKALGGDLKALQMLLNLHQTHIGDAKAQESLRDLMAEDAAILREAGLRQTPEDDDGSE